MKKNVQPWIHHMINLFTQLELSDFVDDEESWLRCSLVRIAHIFAIKIFTKLDPLNRLFKPITHIINIFWVSWCAREALNDTMSHLESPKRSMPTAIDDHLGLNLQPWRYKGFFQPRPLQWIHKLHHWLLLGTSIR